MDIKAFAHITGGGITENLPRILPENLNAHIDLSLWELPPLFQWLHKEGPVVAEEMLKTFNCGMGGIIAVKQQDIARISDELQNAGVENYQIGEIRRGQGEPKVIYTHQDKMFSSIEKLFSHKPQKIIQKKKVAILISGRGSNMDALLRAMEADDYPCECVGVISDHQQAKGLEIAQQRDIPTAFIDAHSHQNRGEYENQLNQQLQKWGAEIICAAGFMRVLSADFCQKWENRALNIHPSLLPSFKGLNTHERAIKAGVRYSGASVHIITSELDGGRIIDQEIVEVLEGDTTQSLADKIVVREHVLYPRALKAFCEKMNG